jgi:ABC-2 family transporter protein
VTRAIWENPIVRRELHGFGHRLRDWRLWVGIRLPREPREWGLPAITWFALAPYIQWVLLLALERFNPSLMRYADPGTIFGVFVLGLGFYACAVAVVIGATTVTREREQATWEQVAVTPMTTAELVLGYWISRALPLGLGVLVSLSTWVLLYPHYMPLLERLGPFGWNQVDLISFGIWLLIEVLFLNAVGLMFSTLCRSSAVAATVAFGGVVLIELLLLGAVVRLIDQVDGPRLYWAMMIAHVQIGGAALWVAGARIAVARGESKGDGNSEPFDVPTFPLPQGELQSVPPAEEERRA